MSEIKVGDRVAAYQILDCGLPLTFRRELIPYRFIGEVTNIWRDYKDLLGIKILSSDKECEIKHTTCHRNWCRRLVKMKKCLECKGSGIYYVYAQDSNGCDYYPICSECNGKGKVRV